MSIVARVADALGYAHRQNVVHRDVKPANVMYEPETDTVKVTDFGIARITDSSKTKTGMVLGTPSYMSPEQLAGKKIDGRSDLFSLAVSLYQMLCGRLPFDGDSMAQLMFKIANEPAPDILQFNPQLRAGARGVPRPGDGEGRGRALPDRRGVRAGAAARAWAPGTAGSRHHDLTRRMNLSQTLEIASCTDPGMVRSHNEDSIAADASKGLVVLADGMGGYNAGEVASGMATTVITTELQQLLDDTPAVRDRAGDREAVRRRGCCASRSRRRTPRSTRRRRASRSTPAWAPRWWRRCSTTTR